MDQHRSDINPTVQANNSEESKINQHQAVIVENKERELTAYYENRCKMIEDLRYSEKYRPYPHKFEVTHSLTQFIKEFNDQIKEKGVFLDKNVSVAGN